QGVVATTFVVSAQSRFARTVKHSGGEAKQMEALAQTLLALLLADTESPRNRSCVEVLRDLGRRSPLASLAFASDRLAPLRLDGMAALLQALRREEVAVGHLEDLQRQAAHVTHQVLTDPEVRAIPG